MNYLVNMAKCDQSWFFSHDLHDVHAYRYKVSLLTFILKRFDTFNVRLLRFQRVRFRCWPAESFKPIPISLTEALVTDLKGRFFIFNFKHEYLCFTDTPSFPAPLFKFLAEPQTRFYIDIINDTNAVSNPHPGVNAACTWRVRGV